MSTLEEAKTFVESFTPWDLYADTSDIEVDINVRPRIEP